MYKEILVIDDNPDIRLLVSNILKEQNFKVFNGLDMFIYQGQKSFYLWNKINPEIDQTLVELLLSKLK